MRENGEGRASLWSLISIAALKAPSVALTAAPFVVMLSTLASFARLARSSELVVIRAAGVSVWALLAPVVACALLVGALTPTALNPVAAAASKRSVCRQRNAGI